ncbi:hypothetical protein M431DRAFT_503353 [Trichoderma harzianum CBS 226.95]|uniref:Uncharacterized protein n=1 Tax=Trichoderma harzianum CBS 226.95 TaxID=983964 RepID=A0A2T4AVX9_TRIHA|nr:hypothetical protein M431DRAFT_503353 [Trichoderma harzianum CBS 226.95]PTB61201.1 hypothetical protein M431DRAFT_503353 [Trichoderma harzianum CBS 226.95]
MAPLSRKKKSVIVLAALSRHGTVSCKGGEYTSAETPRKKKHQRSEPIPSSPPLLPVPVPVHSKERNKLRGRRQQTPPEAEREKKETNDLLTPFSPGPDRQNGPSPACSRVTRNGPLQTRKRHLPPFH